jgi:hypothetical protein
MNKLFLVYTCEDDVAMFWLLVLAEFRLLTVGSLQACHPPNDNLNRRSSFAANKWKG